MWGLWIVSIIWWLPILPTVISVWWGTCGTWGLASGVEPLGSWHPTWRRWWFWNSVRTFARCINRFRHSRVLTLTPWWSWWWFRWRTCGSLSHRRPCLRCYWWCLNRWWTDGWSGCWMLLQADRGSFVANWLFGGCFWRCCRCSHRWRRRRHWCSCPWVTTPGPFTGSWSAAFGIVMWGGMPVRVSPQRRNTVSALSSFFSFIFIFLSAPVPFFAPFRFSFFGSYSHIFKDLQLGENHKWRMPCAVRFTEPKILRN